MSQQDMWSIENTWFEKGFEIICGVDEAGRGPLAGPVCAAAVILPPNAEIPGLNDSKKLSDKKRRELFPIIKEQAIAYGIAFVDHQTIDEINILGDSICSSTENFKSGISFFTRSQDENAAVLGVKAPKASLCNVAVQKHGFVLSQNTYNIDAAVGTVTEGEIDDAVFSTVCNCRLRHFVGEIMQTTSPTTGQDHC